MSMESGENVEKSPKKLSLGKYCVAGGPGNVSCTNNSRTEGISMLVFRGDDVAREKRVRFHSYEGIGQNGSQRKHQYCVPCILNCQTLSSHSV